MASRHDDDSGGDDEEPLSYGLGEALVSLASRFSLLSSVLQQMTRCWGSNNSPAQTFWCPCNDPEFKDPVFVLMLPLAHIQWARHGRKQRICQCVEKAVLQSDSLIAYTWTYNFCTQQLTISLIIFGAIPAPQVSQLKIPMQKWPSLKALCHRLSRSKTTRPMFLMNL